MCISNTRESDTTIKLHSIEAIFVRASMNRWRSLCHIAIIYSTVSCTIYNCAVHPQFGSWHRASEKERQNRLYCVCFGMWCKFSSRSCTILQYFSFGRCNRPIQYTTFILSSLSLLQSFLSRSLSPLSLLSLTLSLSSRASLCPLSLGYLERIRFYVCFSFISSITYNFLPHLFRNANTI